MQSLPQQRQPSRRPPLWQIAEGCEQEATQLAATYGLHPVTARILARRGWGAQGVDAPGFMEPQLRNLRDPFELRDMGGAAGRVGAALRRGERICVYGDYDVDGVTSTAVVVETLRLLGGDPMVVIPHRMRDGYGMNLARIEELARAGVRLIVTVDTGVTAVEEVARAKELGMDVVVTDHHQAGDHLPEAVALVNPNRPDAIYPHGRLCGVGVAFKFSHALLKEMRHGEDASRRHLKSQLDLVALGTIADVVPLLGENRIFVRHGIEAIRKTERPGLQALIAVAGFTDRPMAPHAVAFGLAPRLNAAGRTDDAMLALRLLLTHNRTEARELATRLDDLNRERRTIESEILDASRAEADQSVADGHGHTLVVAGEGWHLGVVGIVASRLVESYDVPAIVLAQENGMAKGSARSIPDFNIHAALAACGAHLEGFGGHQAAAGLRLKVHSLPAFREAINEHARALMDQRDYTRTIHVDAEVSPFEVNWTLYDDLQRLQPFGEGNPAPLLMLRGAECTRPAQIVGTNHLKLRLRVQGVNFDGIGFSRAHLKEVFDAGTVDVLVRPIENVFNGQARLELELEDARPST